MSDSKCWYAVYTRPRWEKKVADQLIKSGIECYCPVRKVKRQWADRKKIVLEPLFTSYVFVNTVESEHLNVIRLSGIINFVYWLGKPAVIRKEEIETIKRFLDDHEDVEIEKVDIHVKDKIKIIGGPLIFEEGSIIEVKHRTVKVYLPSLGYQLIAEIKKTNIKIIEHFTEMRQGDASFMEAGN